MSVRRATERDREMRVVRVGRERERDNREGWSSGVGRSRWEFGETTKTNPLI